MTCIYRFDIDGTGVQFHAPGELQRHDGCVMLVAETTFENALALNDMASFAKPVTIWVEVHGVAVAMMRPSKIRAGTPNGRTVKVAALVYVPDPLTEGMRS